MFDLIFFRGFIKKKLKKKASSLLLMVLKKKKKDLQGQKSTARLCSKNPSIPHITKIQQTAHWGLNNNVTTYTNRTTPASLWWLIQGWIKTTQVKWQCTGVTQQQVSTLFTFLTVILMLILQKKKKPHSFIVVIHLSIDNNMILRAIWY